MKFLYVTTIGGTMDFFKDIAEQLINEGHTLDIATNENDSEVAQCYKKWNCKIYQIDTCRSPLKKGNFKAIGQIRRIVDSNKYDIVHCHTPIAAMCTRFACLKARKRGVKVIYTAHGFHFYKGAPKKNWLIYYPIEKICARFTDVLITINREDFEFARKKMRAAKVEYVPGVGLDLKKFGVQNVDRVMKCRELGINPNATLLLSVGELNDNKNHETVIKAIQDLSDIYYIIAGEGKLERYLQNVIDELGLEKRVKLLGFRTDIDELCSIADGFVFPSFREGLSVSVMEAMASGLPVACSKIRGNTDLIDEQGGVLFDPYSVSSCKNAIEKLLSMNLKLLGQYNREKVKTFEIGNVNKNMEKIYLGEH